LSLTSFSLGSPENLVALLVVPLLLAVVFLVRRRRSKYTVAYTNLETLGSVVSVRDGEWRRYVPLTLFALALTLLAVALAEPSIRLKTGNRSSTVVLLVDVSGSMVASDLNPSRLAAAVLAMHGFIGALPKDDKLGLITFSDKVDVLANPTLDHGLVGAKLDVLSPQGGTALGNGVAAAVKLVASNLAAEGVQHVAGEDLPGAIVLESDGSQNHGAIGPFQAAQLAKQAGVRIYGIALGKRNGVILQGTGFTQLRIAVPPDPGVVAMLARETGGQAFNATNAQDLNSIYRKLDTTVGTIRKRRNIASWFDLAAAVLVLGGVAAARVWGAALP
jgi:Ca-activated chloride channel homolog